MRRDTLWSSLFALVFGLVALGFLTAIDHPDWFHIRPVSGTAAAMANAATR